MGRKQQTEDREAESSVLEYTQTEGQDYQSQHEGYEAELKIWTVKIYFK